MACTSKTKPSFVELDAAGEAVGVDICEVLLCKCMLKIVILNLLTVRQFTVAAYLWPAIAAVLPPHSHWHHLYFPRLSCYRASPEHPVVQIECAAAEFEFRKRSGIGCRHGFAQIPLLQIL
jgi:hypothetical protein